MIYENLHIAANDPMCTHPILEKAFNAIEEGLQMDGLLTWALDDNRLSDHDRNLLRTGFQKMLEGREVI